MRSASDPEPGVRSTSSGGRTATPGPRTTLPRAGRMRWWGWGDPQHPPGLSPHALSFVRETVGAGAEPRPPVTLERVRLR
ncbi:MAG TPA: hypothetical protein VFV03_08005, partial [Solirubrobacteraceae bacterium]|nr:hypothetical protein [Solirubrobacteraceae bacterium]